MEKKELRKKMASLRDAVSLEDRERISSSIKMQLQKMALWKSCDSLYTYISFRSEIDTISIIEMAWKEGKTVAVPKVEGEEMTFYEIHSMEELQPGYMGILEPVTRKKANGQKICLLMPGLAFDKTGNRLGYGGGFYDKYIEKNKENICMQPAVAYEFQILPSIPNEKYDQKVTHIIMQKGIIDIIG